AANAAQAAPGCNIYGGAKRIICALHRGGYVPMFDASRPFEFQPASATVRQSVMGRVLSLLGIAFLCTAGGAVIGTQLGPAAFVLSIVGTIGTFIALMFLREKS